PSPLRYPLPLPPLSHAATRSSRNLRASSRPAALASPTLVRASRYGYPVWQLKHWFLRTQARVTESRCSTPLSREKVLASGSSGLAAGPGRAGSPAASGGMAASAARTAKRIIGGLRSVSPEYGRRAASRQADVTGG